MQTPGQPQQGQPTQPQQSISQKNNQKKWLIIGGSVFGGLILLLLIVVLIILATRDNTVIQVIKETPAPSATPQATKSGLPENISDQVRQLNQEIGNTDLEELEMTYPQLDWEVRF